MSQTNLKMWCAAVIAVAGSLALTVPAQAQSYTAVTVMNGLFNPRGLTVGSDGSIYVAEAGSGGAGTQIVNGGGDTVGYGNTSGVSRLSGGVQTRLIGNLPSLAEADGSGATGLQDIIQAAEGTFYGVTGFGADPTLRANFTQPGENGQGFGRLVQFDFTGTPSATFLADISANEIANLPNTPDGPEANSNPSSLIQTPTGFTVADAGANALFDVTTGNVVSTKTVFPALPTPPGAPIPFYQAVPTAVTYGLDSANNPALFVSQLTGFPFTVGSANIYQVDPTTGSFTTLATGFTTLIDVTYANGALYALELTTNGLANPNPGPGNLWRVDVGTGDKTLLYSGLFLPGGVAIGPNEEIYVTTGTAIPGGGSVVQLVVAAPEPGSIAFLLLGATVPLVKRRKRNATR